MQSNNVLQQLTQDIIDGKINDATWIKANESAKLIRQKREQEHKEATERRRLDEIEAQKLCNAIPRLSKYAHVPENEREYRAYIENCDLTLLEIYRDQMAKGQHKSEYRNDTYFNKVLNFLTLQINIRKASLDPIQEKNRLLREAKLEREELKKTTENITQKLKETTNQFENIKNEINDTIKPNVNSSNKARQYTT